MKPLLKAVKFSALFGLLALLVGGCGDYKRTYYTWDVDGNELLAKDEFYRGAYSYWDDDGNGLVELHEFDYGWSHSPFFDNWDRNDDGVISRDEYDDGWADADVVDEHLLGAFDLWDVIDDDQLTPAEVKDGIYTLWDDDKDGFLEYHEFASNLDAAGLWSNWDVNDDSYVTITEVYYWNPHGKEENSSADSQNNSK